MNAEERELVRKMIEGDARAFEQFSDSYLPALYRFAGNRLGGDRDLTREIVQITVCKVVTNLGSFRGESALLTWMGTICRNEIALHFRRRSRRPWEAHRAMAAEDLANSSEWSSAADVEEKLIRDERCNLVHMVLDLLPPHYGRALEWKYIDNLSVREIAARLEMGAKAAESLLTRARVAFRRQFDRHLEEMEALSLAIPDRARRAVSDS